MCVSHSYLDCLLHICHNISQSCMSASSLQESHIMDVRNIPPEQPPQGGCWYSAATSIPYGGSSTHTTLLVYDFLHDRGPSSHSSGHLMRCLVNFGKKVGFCPQCPLTQAWMSASSTLFLHFPQSFTVQPGTDLELAMIPVALNHERVCGGNGECHYQQGVEPVLPWRWVCCASSPQSKSNSHTTLHCSTRSCQGGCFCGCK